jgi:DNA-binding FadR family transcriptional regulator
LPASSDAITGGSIVDAVCARQPEQAEAVMRDHLRSVITGLRDVAAAAALQ